MILKTFNEWSRQGYRIVKGARHVSRNLDNEPLFSEDQVYMPQVGRGGFVAGGHYSNDDMEEDADFAMAYRLPWG